MNDLQRDLHGAIAAHARLAVVIAGLTDEQAAAPSLLPGWTVGHVLTHIARNADSFVLMVDAANRGEISPQYPGGVEQRNGDIERGAHRPAAELVDDALAAAARLEAAWAATTADGWQGEGVTVAGTAPISELPFRRWRETVVHTSDLGLDFGWQQWPDDYVRLELGRLTMQWASRKPMGLTTLPPEVLAVPERERVAWLMGRTAIDGLEPAGIF